MINRINKIINNKFLRFFKFVFFLRYLFSIFFVATVLFLLIPKFFDYKKKEQIIKSYLSQNYGLEIKRLEKISYNPLPVPYLEIDGFSANFFSKNIDLKTQKIFIYPKLLSIYNYDNFLVNKIKLNNSYIDTNLDSLNLLSRKIFSLKKIYFKNLNFNITSSGNNFVNLKKLISRIMVIKKIK